MALTFQLIVLLGLSSGLWMGADAGCTSDCSLSCPAGWKQNGTRCFKLFTEKKDWSDAEDKCIDEGGNLASVHNESDYEFVRELARPNGQAERVWLGAYEKEEGEWSWAGGEYFPDHFSGWVDPEPNNLDKVEHCMEILHQNEDGDKQPFNDAPCNVEKAFICVRHMSHSEA